MDYIDVDWADEKEVRKSTIGGCIVFGQHLIKGWAKIKSLIVLGSIESEFYLILLTASETLDFIVMIRDMGYTI